MQIQKVLNNNVVVALDENGAETVLMGRGLGFGCRPGGEVCQAKVEKRFSLHSDQLSSRFQQLVTSIPLPHFMMSERIINHAKLSLGRELSDSIYVTLPDHISGAISRYKEGIRLQNPLLWDIQQFYKDEYQVGLKANEIVLEETGVAFTEDEAGFIAMHADRRRDPRGLRHDLPDAGRAAHRARGLRCRAGQLDHRILPIYHASEILCSPGAAGKANAG